jgi:hypothetical protein
VCDPGIFGRCGGECRWPGDEAGEAGWPWTWIHLSRARPVARSGARSEALGRIFFVRGTRDRECVRNWPAAGSKRYGGKDSVSPH